MKAKLIALILLVVFASCSNRPKNNLEENHLKGKITNITVSQYDAEIKFGNVVKGKVQRKSKVTFNSVGNVETTDNTYYYGAGDSAEVNHNKFRFEYDGEARNIKIISIGDPKNYSVKKYNGDLLIENDSYDGGKLTDKTKYIYNNDKLLSEINSYDKDGKFTGKEKLFKNEKGWNIAAEIYKSTGELKYKFVTTYDAEGNTITERQTAGEYPFSHTLKYSNIDSKGNWLTSIQYSKGKPIGYSERKIQYR